MHAYSMKGGLEDGWGKKGEGGNDAIIGNRGGRYYAIRVGHASIPPGDNVIMNQMSICPPTVMTLS